MTRMMWRGVVAAVTCLLVATMAIGAGAAPPVPPTASFALAGPSRQLMVTDLTGQALSALTLASGHAQAFRVTVDDNGVGATQPFVVQSTMNNLYLQTDPAPTYDFTRFIPSGNVTSTSSAVADVNGLSGTVAPLYTIALDDTPCDDQVALLALIVADAGLDLLADGPGLVAPLATACTAFQAVTGAGTSLTFVTGPGQDIDLVQAAADAGASVPTGLLGGESGPFTHADHTTGIGGMDVVNDTTGATTTRLLLSGRPLDPGELGELTPALLDALEDGGTVIPDGTQPVSALVGTTTLTTALAASSDPEIQALSSALVNLPADIRDAVVDRLFSLSAGAVEPVIQTIAGSYGNVATVGVATAAGIDAGDYTGTFVVTLIDGTDGTN